jgi:oligosaccharide repeat unit polymerase
MTVAQIISLLLIIIVLYTMTRNKSDLLSPAKIFILLWATVIILVEFKFSKFQQYWSFYSWFVLLTGLLSFLLGLYITYVLNLDKRLLTIDQIRNKIQNYQGYNKDNFFVALTVLFVLYTSALIIEIFIVGFIPIFHPKPDTARIEFAVFGLHLLVGQMPVILLLVVEYLIMKSGSRKKNYWAIFYFIFTFLSYFLLIIRFNYIYWLVMSIALLYYATRFINFRRILYTSAVLMFFFNLLMTIRFSQYAAQFLHVVSKMKYSYKYAGFSGFYMYVVMNIENMARAADKIESYTYSYMTLDWVYALSGLKHWMRDYFSIDPRPFIISGYNTFPFLLEYYLDFGLIGLLIFPMLTGFIIGMLYYKLRTKGTLDYAVYYAFGFFLIVISFFTNPITMLNINSNILVIWIVHRFVLMKRTKVPDNA